MAAVSYQEIKAQLRELYVHDERPWLVGFSGGKAPTTSSVVRQDMRH